LLQILSSFKNKHVGNHHAEHALGTRVKAEYLQPIQIYIPGMYMLLQLSCQYKPSVQNRQKKHSEGVRFS